MKKKIENLIFGSKWLLVPFYFGLIIVMIIYTYVYSKEIIHLIAVSNEIDKEMAMLLILEIVDIVMIANLVRMIISGSYNSFVDKGHGNELEHVGSGALKVKMATSLIGISSIHLLQTFIHIGSHSWEELNKQLAIHAAFILGAFVLAIIDHLHTKDEHIQSTRKNTPPRNTIEKHN